MTKLRIPYYPYDPTCNCGERYALQELVNRFAKAMFRKLEAKLDEGFSGWDDPVALTIEEIKRRLHEQIESGDPIDIANFAAFWWNRLPEDET